MVTAPPTPGAPPLVCAPPTATEPPAPEELVESSPHATTSVLNNVMPKLRSLTLDVVTRIAMLVCQFDRGGQRTHPHRKCQWHPSLIRRPEQYSVGARTFFSRLQRAARAPRRSSSRRLGCRSQPWPSDVAPHRGVARGGPSVESSSHATRRRKEQAWCREDQFVPDRATLGTLSGTFRGRSCRSWSGCRARHLRVGSMCSRPQEAPAASRLARQAQRAPDRSVRVYAGSPCRA